MASWPKTIYALVLLILIFGLAACSLPRDNAQNADLQPVEVLPPTLAPLGSEGDQVATEATPIPTVINVQPTATTSSLGPGEAAPSPNESTAPTTQPASIPAEPAVTSSQAEQVSAAPETFVAPSQGATASEPVVVDATTQSSTDQPLAANPPFSNAGAPDYNNGAYMVQPGDTLFSLSQRYGTTVEAIMIANGLTSDMLYAGQSLIIPGDDGSSYYPQAPGQMMPEDNGPGYYPQGPGQMMPGYGGNRHIVAPGETLFRLALNYGTSVEAIASANGIPYPYIIQPGQPLIIPEQGVYSGPPQPPAGGYYPPNPYYPPQQGPGGYYPPANPYMPQAPDGNYYPQYPPQGPEGGYYPGPDNNSPMPGGGATHTVAPGETLNSIARRYGTTPEILAQANGLANPNQIYVGQVLYLP